MLTHTCPQMYYKNNGREDDGEGIIFNKVGKKGSSQGVTCEDHEKLWKMFLAVRTLSAKVLEVGLDWLASARSQ